MTKYSIYKTENYNNWIKTQPLKSQRQIFERLLKIEESGHFGHIRNLGKISELKFADGRRIYYAIVPKTIVILLLGGNKNGQDKDIKKATKIFSQIN